MRQITGAWKNSFCRIEVFQMGLFDYDSTLSVLLRRLAGCFALGATWLICCLPVVTAGAASAALYATVEKHIIREEENLLIFFFRNFRENFKNGTLLWLVFLGLGLFLCWDLYFFLQMFRNGSPEGILWIVIAAMLLLQALTMVYAFSYTARFEDRVGRILKNSVLLMLTHPLVNLKLLVIFAVIALVLLTEPLLLVALPGFFCWTICTSMEKIFQRIKNSSRQVD